MAATHQSACPDCPAARNRVLGRLAAGYGMPCVLQCVSVEARKPLPQRWFTEFGLALVRRGILVRQRVDPEGAAAAVDAIGPGGAVPLFDDDSASSSGYAADDALLCLVPRQPLSDAVDAGAPTAAEVVALHRAALDRVERIAQARNRPTAVERLGALLCALADTLSPPQRLECIPSALQQRDLAALLSMRHESVCRATRILQAQGGIERTDRGIHLKNRALLV